MADTGTQPPSPPFEPPGVEEVARLFPQLEILAFIGKGGMGAVYKARQPALDRLVALKILPPQAASGLGFTGRFNREARALAKLNHPNIVTVHEFGQVQGLPFFLMEFVDGLNLRQLERAGKLSPREALQIVPQICEALQFAHDEGIVHRDIKPENILLDKKGRVKIADFGIAKIMGGEQDIALTETKGVIGTLHYMAPEQVDKPQTVDHRADIFSLGVVFYEMLTGELPLGKFAPPSRKVVVDVRLDEVVLRALEKEPELRYQHASVLKTDVETIAATPTRSSSSQREEICSEKHEAQASPPALSPTKSGAANGQFLRVPSAGLLAVGAINFTIFLLGCGGLLDAIGSGVAEMRAAIGFIPCLLFLFASGLTIFGAIQMGRLSSYGLALAGSVLAIVTPSPLLPLGVCFGLLALLRLTRRGVREAFKANKARRVTTSKGPESFGPLRFSRTAIVGACWAVPGCVVLFCAATHPFPTSLPPWQKALTNFALPALGLIAFFGTTILGWISVSQIRRSAGRLYGLGLAVFDGLLFPLLALDGAFFGICRVSATTLTGNPYPTHPALAVSFVVWLVVSIAADLLIIRSVWRAVNRPLNGAIPSATAPPVNVQALPASRSAWKIVAVIGAAAVLLIAIAIGVVALLLPFWRATGHSRPEEQAVPVRRAETVSNLAFGPVNVRVLGYGESDSMVFLDLDTDKASQLKDLFPENAVPSEEEIYRKARAAGIDVFGNTDPEVRGLVGFDMVAFPVSATDWDNEDAHELARDLAISRPGTPTVMSAKGGLPATFLFKTGDGGMGILQITGLTDKPGSVKIRYKLAQTTTNGAQAPTALPEPADLREAKAKLAELRVNYADTHPQVQTHLKRIEELERLTREEPNAPADLREAKAKLAELRVSYADGHPAVQAQFKRIEGLERRSTAPSSILIDVAR